MVFFRIKKNIHKHEGNKRPTKDWRDYRTEEYPDVPEANNWWDEDVPATDPTPEPDPIPEPEPENESNAGGLLVFLLLAGLAIVGMWQIGFFHPTKVVVSPTPAVTVPVKPDVATPPVTKPEVVKPEVVKPKVTKPKVKKPKKPTKKPQQRPGKWDPNNF